MYKLSFPLSFGSNNPHSSDFTDSLSTQHFTLVAWELIHTIGLATFQEWIVLILFKNIIWEWIGTEPLNLHPTPQNEIPFLLLNFLSVMMRVIDVLPQLSLLKSFINHPISTTIDLYCKSERRKFECVSVLQNYTISNTISLYFELDSHRFLQTGCQQWPI